MALVDSLLRLMVARGAESLTLATARVPSLRRRGEIEPLAMPPIDEAIVDGAVGEVLADDELRADFATRGRSEVDHEVAGVGRFSVLLRRDDQGVVLTFAPAVSAAPEPRRGAPPSPTAPATATGAGPTALLAILRRAEHEGASDLLLTTGQPSRMRVAGELTVLEVDCSDADLLELFGDALDDDARARLDRHGSVDLALDHRGVGGMRHRVNLFRQHRGLAAALRPIREDPPTLRKLGLPDDLHEIVSAPHGLVLITGPAGSGKSTTMVALTEHINRSQRRHIIALEDPIEYEYTSRQSLIHQREVGAQVESFGAGLRAALRESPDVIVLGEMRDLETIAAALTAAEAGHLVISTLHCNRAVDAIDRIIDVFPGSQQRQVRTQLAMVLRSVVTQFLLPTLASPRRVPAVERLVVTPAVAAMIREDKCHQIQSQIQTGRTAGMEPLERQLARLVREKVVSIDAACRVAVDPAELRALIAGR